MTELSSKVRHGKSLGQIRPGRRYENVADITVATLVEQLRTEGQKGDFFELILPDEVTTYLDDRIERGDEDFDKALQEFMDAQIDGYFGGVSFQDLLDAIVAGCRLNLDNHSWISAIFSKPSAANLPGKIVFVRNLYGVQDTAPVATAKPLSGEMNAALIFGGSARYTLHKEIGDSGSMLTLAIEKLLRVGRAGDSFVATFGSGFRGKNRSVNKIVQFLLACEPEFFSHCWKGDLQAFYLAFGFDKASEIPAYPGIVMSLVHSLSGPMLICKVADVEYWVEESDQQS